MTNELSPQLRTFLDKVNAGLHFGVPDTDTHKAIMDELVDLVSWRGWSRNEVPAVRWHPNDLDRCTHGRHSFDWCSDCPGPYALGNPFLLEPHALTGRVRNSPDQKDVEIRIGTMVHGEPIWVPARRLW